MTLHQIQPEAATRPDDPVAIALLQELLAIPSVSGDERAAVAFLVEQMAALGLAATIDGAGNAIGTIGAGQPETVLLGHIDTVPGVVPLRQENGRLYGRGAVDAKGSLAAFVIAAARLGAYERLHGRIVVIGCVEEEVASSRGAHYVVDRYRPDHCIVGEPSGWNRVTLGYKGSLRIRCRAAGPCTHSAHQHMTTPERLSNFWQQIAGYAASFNAGRERSFDQLLPALLHINSDSDGLSEWTSAEISLRLPPDLPSAGLLPIIQRFDPQLELTVLGATPAFRAERNTVITRALTRAIRQQRAQPSLVLKTGTADMNIVGPAWSCPIVAYGPGDAALDHTPDEHIVLAEYLQSIDVLTTALRQLHSADPESILSAPAMPGTERRS
jgi:[amino group carrier protein]-lysine/ornithine hydrolase